MDTIRDMMRYDTVDLRATVLARICRFLLSIPAERGAADGEEVAAQSPEAAESESSKKLGSRGYGTAVKA